MGQSLKKLAPGTEEKKVKVIGPVIDKCYDEYFKDGSKSFADFYRGVCSIVEEINQKLGNTQFKVPKTEALKDAYDKHHKGPDKVTKAEFQEILKEVVTRDSGFTGIGAKETLLYIFGVPLTTLFLKQRVMPNAIGDEIFIPGITSITVLVLAALNKI
ncbi:PREDICTED: uncharacterized protein LOC109342557 [Lupinus angustifolius]|uniref:uncharacterized protein LOC109342557 n=1 Tax=Lupinus angustifolius TaxID=3871 RepID=UPI00092E32B3|nr:PREDICTED: uncharacterized protein LOC109342557 [Lupinus angustifolius]